MQNHIFMWSFINVFLFAAMFLHTQDAEAVSLIKFGGRFSYLIFPNLAKYSEISLAF